MLHPSSLLSYSEGMLQSRSCNSSRYAVCTTSAAGARSVASSLIHQMLIVTPN